MLDTVGIEKAIEMFEGGASEAAVAERACINPDEAKAVAEALYLGQTERLFREIALAAVLEAAAQALRSGRGLITTSASELVQEIRHIYPDTGIPGKKADHTLYARRSSVNQTGVEKDEETFVRGTCNILVKIDGSPLSGEAYDAGEYMNCGKPSVYSEPCSCDRCDTEPGYHLPSHWCAEHTTG
jgi:hypothetical protein